MANINSSYLEWFLEVQKKEQELNKITNEYGVSFEQYLVLEQIKKYELENPSKIAANLRTSNPAVSRKINTLQNKKFIHKVYGNKVDQRIVKIETTDQGDYVYDHIKAVLEQSWTIIMAVAN